MKNYMLDTIFILLALLILTLMSNYFHPEGISSIQQKIYSDQKVIIE